MNIDVAIAPDTALRGGFSTVAVRVPDLGVEEILDIDLGDLHDRIGEPDPIVLDLLLVSGIAYIVDKAVPRRTAEDFWTRRFEVEFPVSDPSRWRAGGDQLVDALSFLTGDEWSARFAMRSGRLFAPRKPRLGQVPLAGERLCLFSGGLDSLVGAIDALASGVGKMALVGHHDATLPAGDQHRLWRKLDETEYRGRTELYRPRLRPLPPSLAQSGQRVILARQGHEATLRSRSLVFLALGVYSAHAIDETIPVLVPENGFIAINIPLSPSRIGSCSTRTTHPYFVAAFRALLASLGLRHPIENPLAGKTKGEVLSRCQDQATLLKLGRETVSCAHASRRVNWIRRSARNCGYCVPCLIRRAAFHYIVQDDGSEYGIDALGGELDPESSAAADFRAVLDCLSQVQTQKDIEERVMATGPLGAGFGEAIEVVSRGLDELRRLIRDKCDADFRRLAAL